MRVEAPTPTDNQPRPTGKIRGGPGTKRLRIRLLIHTNGWGGMEGQTAALARTLAARGHDVAIVELQSSFFTERTDSLGPDVRVERIELDEPLNRIGFRRWYHIFRRLDADVGVFAKGWTEVGSAALDLAARLAFRRFIAVEHTTPPPRPPRVRRRHFGGLLPGLGYWWYRQVSRIYFRSIGPHRIATVSRSIAVELTEKYWYARSKVVAIPNGVDADRFAPSPQQRTSVRSAWGVPGDAFVFGSVSRLSNLDKGLDVGIEQFARLCDARPDLPLWYVLVGDGPDRDALREQAASTRWRHRILFPGYTDRPWEAYAGIDVLLVPSRYEGIGLSVMEAMAAECCSIAMGVGGLTEVITDASVGWLVGAADRDAFLAAMREAVLLGEADRRAMGRRARRHIIRHFRGQDQLAELADLIDGAGERQASA